MPGRDPPADERGATTAPTSRRAFLAATGSAAGLGLAAPASGARDGDETIRVVASPAQQEAARDAAERLEADRADAAVQLDVATSTPGLGRFADGEADVVAASRPMLPGERSRASDVDDERREVATARDTLSRPGSAWVDCLRPGELADAWTSDGAVDVWAEAVPDDSAPGSDGGAATPTNDEPDGDATDRRRPVDDGTVLVRGVRASQYASGRGGVGYYEPKREWLAPSADGDAGTPVVRLGILYASGRASARPLVDEFVAAYEARSRERVGELEYYDDPFGIV